MGGEGFLATLLENPQLWAVQGKPSLAAQPFLFWKLVTENPEDSKTQGIPYPTHWEMRSLGTFWRLRPPRGGLGTMTWSAPSQVVFHNSGERDHCLSGLTECLWHGGLWLLGRCHLVPQFPCASDLLWYLFCLTLVSSGGSRNWFWSPQMPPGQFCCSFSLRICLGISAVAVELSQWPVEESKVLGSIAWRTERSQCPTHR